MVRGRKTVLAAVLLVAGIPAGLFGQVIFNGTIDAGAGQEWGSPKASAVQDNHTGYGDQHLTPGGFPGSELDELYVRTDGTYLYVGLTANLEQNGNSIVLLFDTAAGGQNVLATEIAPRTDELPCAPNGPPSAVQGLGQALLRDLGTLPDDAVDDVTSRDPASTGTKLDAGFAPDHALAIDTNGGQVFVSQYALSATSLGTWDDPSTGVANCGAPNEALEYYATRVYRGVGTVNSGNGTLTGGTNPGGLQVAFNNTGKLGVTGESPNPPPAPGSGSPGDPRSQTTGLEARIRLSDLGLTVPLTTTMTIKIAAVLTSTTGFVSNQTLPGIAGGNSLANPGFRPDFTAIAGDQYATVTRTTAQFGAPSGSVDGTAIPSSYGLANLVASQNTVTGFGDRNCLTATGGSELDELYLRTDGQNLFVGLTGNLEGNGNAHILLIDVQPGGQNVLKTEIAPVLSEMPCSWNAPPGAVQGLGQRLVHNDNATPGDTTDDVTLRDEIAPGTALDSGFEPDYAIAVDTAGGNVHVTQYNMTATEQGTWDDPSTGQPDCAAPNEALPFYATRVYRGQIAVNSLSTGPASLTGGVNVNGSEFAFNNTGIGGVTVTDVAAPASGLVGDPRTQTRGLEARISLADLGFGPGQLPVASLSVKVAVLLTSGDGTVSSQVLPGTGLGTDGANLGPRPNFPSLAGDQYASAVLTAAPFSPSLDGRDIVGEFGTTNVVASQNTVTGFGDVSLTTVTDCDQQLTAGSEIDRLIVQDTPDALQIAITGNLENNGNNLIIFLDTIPGVGESLLDANTGRVSGMNGDTIPLQADYALVVNLFGGNAHVDLVNLVNNTNLYVGAEVLNTGDGILDKGGPVPDWSFFIDNTNIFGVSGTNTDDPQTAAALTATTGLEISIPLSAIGSPTPGTPACVFALISNNGADWLSNQFLPAGLGGFKPNFDNGTDDLVLAGFSCLSFTFGPTGPTCNDPRFDSDNDDDVDSDDFAAFQRCYNGLAGSAAGLTLTSECECFDWNLLESDGLVNLEDLGVFELCGSGPDVPANPACDDTPAN